MNALALVGAVLLLLGNAVFVAAEFALVGADRDAVAHHADEGSSRARAAIAAIDGLTVTLAGAQLGVTLCSLGLGAVAEPAVAHLLEGPLGGIGIEAHGVAVAVALALVVSAHMVLGEMVPKGLALAGTTEAALLLGPPMMLFVRLTGPVVRLLDRTAGLLVGLLGVHPAAEGGDVYDTDDLAGIITESLREGLIDPDEAGRLTEVLAFGGRSAAAVTLPLDDLVTVGRETSTAEVEALVARTGFSRFPVLVPHGAGPSLIGYVHVKDLLAVPAGDRDLPVPASTVRRVLSVDERTALGDVLTRLQREGAHLAAVTRRGVTVGALTLEDVVEALVGELVDAEDAVAPGVTVRHRSG